MKSSLFPGKLAMVTEHIPSLYIRVCMCHLLLVQGHPCHTGWRPEPCRKRGLGRAEMGARQGQVPVLGLEQAQWLSRAAWESRHIQPIPVLLPGFVWKLGSTQEGFVFPLLAHFGLDSLVSLPGARRSHQWPGGSHSFLSHSQ